MNSTPENPSIPAIRPPQLIPSLTGGFNAIASHIYLILLPVALDLLLWFGPHLRLKTLLEPSLTDLMGFLRQAASTDMRPALDSAQKLYELLLTQYNLLVALATIPVGVPSLMAGELPTVTPLGAPQLVEVHSSGQMLLGWLALSLLGLLFGSIYFAGIARSIGGNRLGGAGEPQVVDCNTPLTQGRAIPPFKAGVIGWQTLQVLVLIIILALIVLVLMIPSFFMASFLALISPALAQFALIVISLGVLWFLIPLVFSPHGIFLCGQSALNALFTSARMVRILLPPTGLFLLACVVLYQGLNLLWRAAPDNSWMVLIGIFGHAFITTGLLAASFTFYRSGLVYVQGLRRLAMNSQRAV
jgi:hypothetical protein